MKRLIGITTLLIACAASASIPDSDLNWMISEEQQGEHSLRYSIGFEYYDRKDFVQAHYWTQKAADQNEPEAQYLLGLIYENGQGVTQDYPKAIEWFKTAGMGIYASQLTQIAKKYHKKIPRSQHQQSAYIKGVEKGDKDALNLCGQMYYYGTHVKENRQLAKECFQLAAQKGDLFAQSMLGLMYAEERNFAESAKWFQAPAEKGDALSQYYLGLFYTDGTGVTQDYLAAIKWLKQAGKAYDPYEISGFFAMEDL